MSFNHYSRQSKEDRTCSASWQHWQGRLQHRKLSSVVPLTIVSEDRGDDARLPYRRADGLDDTAAILQYPPPAIVSDEISSFTSSDRAFCSYEVSLKAPPTDIRKLPLPLKQSNKVLRHLHLTWFTFYRRLFSIVLFINLVVLLFVVRKPIDSIDVEYLATAASSNFLIAIAIRQDCVVNALFRTAWLVPWSTPLRVRKMIARVYAYGGIHGGAAVAGTIWWIAFTTLLTMRFARQYIQTLAVLAMAWIILMSLVSICLMAIPTLRSTHHNTFENTHRFMGWASILLFWIQLGLLMHRTSKSATRPIMFVVVHTPTFYNLLIINSLLIAPWLHLRKWTFTAEKLSNHAVRLRTRKAVHKFSCLSIAKTPLGEYHPFATFPSNTGSDVIVSAAGDWTKSLMQCEQGDRTGAEGSSDKTTRRTVKFWVKGTPKAGVLSLSCIFQRVVIVTTGSGIGPSLSSLLDRPPAQCVRLVWSTRSPVQTFGSSIVDLINEVDRNAVVIDTDEMGRPDLVRVAWNAYMEIGAEAVFVLSNEVVTKKVVYGLASRGVPAFGPIFDS